MHVGVNQVLLRSKGKQKGEGLPPSAPCGVVCGQVSALRSVDLTTASRLRRADTPICKEENPKRKPIRITVLSRAHPPSYGSTYLSGKAVQTNRATSALTSLNGCAWTVEKVVARTTNRQSRGRKNVIAMRTED